MNVKSALAAGVCAAVLIGAAPAKKAAAGPAQPVASYWMDVATASGFGAGMSPGMDAAQVMAMMRGGAGVGHTLDLRLASKTRPAGAPQADHFVPAALQMGPSLPLLTPVREAAPPPSAGGLPANYRPKGRMLIYWGCGEHVSPGQPTVIDFAQVAAGKAPQGMMAMGAMAKLVSGPHSAPGFGRWPNEKDPRPVPAAGSLVGAHRVAGNYSPEIAFSLGAGQDFMPGLGLREAGVLPSGAARLAWTPAAQATGYALAMFGATQSGDMIMWSSAKSAQMVAMDYVAPAEVKRLIAAGAALPPTQSECLLPAEVAAAVPAGMVTMIGYGPEANFADPAAPKNPKWTAKVRYKTTASLMRGMGAMMGRGMDAAGPRMPPQQQPPQRRKRRSLLGDIIQGATGIPTEE